MDALINNIKLQLICDKAVTQNTTLSILDISSEKNCVLKIAKLLPSNKQSTDYEVIKAVLH